MKNRSNRPRAKALIWNHRSIMRYDVPWAATIEVSVRTLGPAMAEVGGLHHLAPRLLHLHGEASTCSIQQFLKGFIECIQKASCDVKDWSLNDFSQLDWLPCGAFFIQMVLSFLHYLHWEHVILHCNLVDIHLNIFAVY